MNIRAFAALAILAATSPVFAQPITDSFTYQGTLMDDGVTANGFYDIALLIADSAVGGSIVQNGTILIPNVEVADGLFEVFVDFNVSGIIFDSDQTRWLQIDVREVGDTLFNTLSPRQRMSPVPLANYALRSGFAQSSATSLQAAYNNGNAIIRGLGDPAVQIRSSVGANPARLNLGSNAGGEPQGRFLMYTSAGGTMFSLEQDADNGGGGFLSLARNNAGSSGFLLDGNYNDTESSRFRMLGQSGSIVFDTSVSGNESAKFLNDSISAAEILDEPGAAETASSGALALTNVNATVDVINSISIDCPTSGYVLVLATGEVSVFHETGSTSTVNIGVSPTTDFPSNGDIEVRIDSAAASGTYDYPVTVHALFSATQGLNTFYFLGDKNNVNGGVQVIDRQVTALFIPTAYGSAFAQSGQDTPDEFSPINAPMSSNDIIIEQNAAIIANNQRLERELDAMKLQMQQILEQTQQSLEEQQQD